MVLKKLLHRRRSRSKGQSLVEFALLLPVFLVIVSVALDLGRIASARVTIANVAREASFQAALTPTSYQAGQPCATDTNMVICRGLLESKGSPVTVAAADITMTCSPSCATGTMGNRVTVTAKGKFKLLTPIIAVFFGGTSITFSSTATNQISALPATAIATSAPTPTPSPTPTPTPTPVPTPSPTPSCSSVSAGFTVAMSPTSGKSPVTVTVTDTTTYNPACSTVWEWDWDNGPKTYGKVPGSHVYSNNSANNKTFILKLKVTSGTFTSTTGGYSIVVTP